MDTGQQATPGPSVFYGIDEEDAILEPDVEKRLTKFLDSEDQNVFSVGELLASGYQGIPDIIRTLLLWARCFTDDTDNLLRQATETTVLEMEPKLVPLINHALTTSDFSLPSIDAINQSPTWQPFFADLADRHPNSVLANALKRQHLLSAADVNKEAFTSPSTFCDEFAKLLISNVSDEPGTHPTLASPRDVYTRISALCAYDECTTKTALYILARLAREAEHPVTRMFARRLSQHVRAEAVTQIHTVGTMPSTAAGLPAESVSAEDAKIHGGRLCILANCVAADCPMRSDVVEALLVVAISSIDVGDFRTAINIDAEVSLVTNAYATLMVGLVRSAGHPLGNKNALPQSLRLDPVTYGEKSVLIRAVCEEAVLDPLLHAAFSVHRRPSPDDALNPNKKRALCLLLAFARVFVSMADEELLTQLRVVEQTRALCTEVSAQFQRIEVLVSTCEKLKPSCAAYQIKEEKQTLISAAEDSFFARGILIWATEGVLGGSNLRDLRKTAVIHLAFLAMLADKHVGMRQGVVNAISTTMTRDYGELEDMEIADIKREVMRCISSLLRRGLGLLLVSMFADDFIDSNNVDLAHFRQFLSDLLEIATPPFSDEFVNSVMRLIDSDRLVPLLSKDSQLQRAVTKFKQQTTQVHIL